MDAKCLSCLSKTKNGQLPKPSQKWKVNRLHGETFIRHPTRFHGDGASKMQEGRSTGYSACVAHQTPASTIIQGN